MSTATAQQATPTTSARAGPRPLTHGPHAQSAEPFGTIDFTSVSKEESYRVLSNAATTTGVALISALPVRPPMAAIQALFARLYADAVLVSRLNATYPKRGVFKNACLAPDASSKIDQKTTIDLSINRLKSIRTLDPTLDQELGKDFQDILNFYTYVENYLLPIVTHATASISGADLKPIHTGTNNHLRLIDYFPSPDPPAPRCGEHRDYNTYMIVFQDGAVGGLELEVDGTWTSIPKNVDAVVTWGWCGAILTNNVVKAAKHRVLKTWPSTERRTTAVVFVAPELNTPLKPMGGLEKGIDDWSREIRDGRMTVGAFKEVIAKKWRRREGNEPGEVIQGEQGREVGAFLKPTQVSS
ncbi:hypothetical protein FB567DRAFT_557260 [Paraphoma chrysanthemicola]|uniref:Fe2OG dioxygenase domain-containing protein n=1 Tax=Paraphoma chrysanthemicola TaxID=798071 RepID=A0A8K0W3G0_9PLEO|nr:hypothetical protein FB567DRAFT_557260 [Paraphoma chrysanthemicola]